MKDVLDEVMNYEPSGIVPDMKKHTLDDDEPEVDNTLDDGQDVVNGFTQSQKPCLVDLSLVGWDELEKVNVKDVRKHKIECLQRKRDTMKYIMRQVIEMKSSSRSIAVCQDNTTAEISTWSTYLKELRPNYYV
jgi:hypothetical protein